MNSNNNPFHVAVAQFLMSSNISSHLILTTTLEANYLPPPILVMRKLKQRNIK